MARKNRIIYPGQCYHVMVRGVNGQNIFYDEKDRIRYCHLLEEASRAHAFDVHGFCLMSNHVHLLVQPHSENLSSGMHFLSFRYAQFFNRKTERRGHLFQGRYKAILVQHGAHLCRVIRYIHRNPMRANLVRDLSNYLWSSYRTYIGSSFLPWLNTQLILSLFGSTQDEALSAFHKYIDLDDEQAKKELIEIRHSTQAGAYGHARFIEEFKSQASAKTTSRTLAKAIEAMVDTDSPFRLINLEAICKCLQESTNTLLVDLKSKSRKRKYVDARALLVWLSLKFNAGTKANLTALLNRQLNTINRLHQRVNQFPELRQCAANLEDFLTNSLGNPQIVQ